jgi:LysM repeat protein
VGDTYVYTIEGNTSSSSGVVANGGCVAEKKYKLSYGRIAGYGRPDYNSISTSEISNKTETANNPTNYQCIYVVVKGDSLWNIAKKYLGKGKRYKEIMTLNNKKTETIIVGEKLKIPNK